MLNRSTAALIGLAAVLLGSSLSACSSATAPSADPATTTGPSATPVPNAPTLSPVHVVKGERPHFSDDQGREVLLRGVNVNTWGDYYQVDPAVAPTRPMADADWSAMASLGFSAVRLIVSWSALEPERGQYDTAYVDRVRTAITDAGRHGLYVIVDMHQDAWGKAIASPTGTTCGDGLEPAIGWDGAPPWATITDGADTCRVDGQRELAPAVITAFTNFYANRDGIRDSLVTAWGHLAGRVADLPGVVGYDLFNEPFPSAEAATIGPQYAAFISASLGAIRQAEQQGGTESRIVFVEPIVTWPLPGTAPDAGVTSDPNVAFAPHNYFGSISKALTVEQGFAANLAEAKTLGVPFWTGEYGWWDAGAESMATLRRFATAEDQAVGSGAWWQWRQGCGDPHSLNNPEHHADDQLHLNGLGCPGDRDLGLTAAYATVVSRAYPKATPGSVTSLVSDPDARTMSLHAEGPDGGNLVVWVPDNGHGPPHPSGVGLRDLAFSPVPGGFRVTATTSCRYQLDIDAPSASVPGSSTATSSTC
jgi:endoglycosylceramidase